MGVKKLQAVSAQQMRSFLDEHHVATAELLEVDSVRYRELVVTKAKDSSVYAYPAWYVQNHVQPVQVIYYDNYTQKPVAAFFNCIANSRGLTNFTWNKFGELDTFPPKEYTSWRWIDTLFSMVEITGAINNLSSGQPLALKNNDKRYSVLLFYALFVEKQAVNLVHETHAHLNRFIPGQYNIYYVNMDNYLSHVLNRGKE